MNRRRSETGAAFARLLGGTYPEGVVELPDYEESYFWRLEPQLKMRLQTIPGAGLFYQRSWNGEEESGLVVPVGTRSDDGETEWSLAGEEGTVSYQVYFLGLDNPEYTYVCEGEPDEVADETQDAETKKTFLEEPQEGTGWIGCCVAVSLVAPVGLLVLGTFEVYGPSHYTYPTIEHTIFGLDGKPLDLEEHFQEAMGPEATLALRSVRDQAAAALRACHIRVLSEPEANHLAAGLRPGEDVFIRGQLGASTLTVKDAFFFGGP